MADIDLDYQTIKAEYEAAKGRALCSFGIVDIEKEMLDMESKAPNKKDEEHFKDFIDAIKRDMSYSGICHIFKIVKEDIIQTFIPCDYDCCDRLDSLRDAEAWSTDIVNYDIMSEITPVLIQRGFMVTSDICQKFTSKYSNDIFKHRYVKEYTITL